MKRSEGWEDLRREEGVGERVGLINADEGELDERFEASGLSFGRIKVRRLQIPKIESTEL